MHPHDQTGDPQIGQATPPRNGPRKGYPKGPTRYRSPLSPAEVGHHASEAAQSPHSSKREPKGSNPTVISPDGAKSTSTNEAGKLGKNLLQLTTNTTDPRGSFPNYHLRISPMLR